MRQHSFTKTSVHFLILALLIIFPSISQADCQVTLQWDANNPAPEGYQVFGREAGMNYDYDTPWWQGDQTFTQCTIDGLDETKTYFFVVRAYEGDEVSVDSNEVSYTYSDSASSGDSTSSGDSSSSSLDSNTAVSAGGGSGSGCFIQSLFH